MISSVTELIETPCVFMRLSNEEGYNISKFLSKKFKDLFHDQENKLNLTKQEPFG